jgi:hypothetical protein
MSDKAYVWEIERMGKCACEPPMFHTQRVYAARINAGEPIVDCMFAGMQDADGSATL